MTTQLTVQTLHDQPATTPSKHNTLQDELNVAKAMLSSSRTKQKVYCVANAHKIETYQKLTRELRYLEWRLSSWFGKGENWPYVEFRTKVENWIAELFGYVPCIVVWVEDGRGGLRVL